MGNSLTLLGAGAWGTALAITFAHHGVDVYLWGRRSEFAEQIARERENRRYLPGIKLPDSIEVGARLNAESIVDRDLLMVVPSLAFADVLAQIHAIGRPASLTWATKGLDPASGNLLHEVVKERLGDIPMAVVSGPSFADAVARDLPTAVVIASKDIGLRSRIQATLHGGTLRAYASDDLIGVEIGGAAKNVMAIAAGISDGLGFGVNARAALISRGLAEIQRLGVGMGGEPETFMGLSGVGDLVLTCTGDLSRNRRLGLALASGVALEQALSEIGQTVEGAVAAPMILNMGRRHQIELPITEQMVALLEGRVGPEQAAKRLLEREQRSEFGC